MMLIVLSRIKGLKSDDLFEALRVSADFWARSFAAVSRTRLSGVHYNHDRWTKHSFLLI